MCNGHPLGHRSRSQAKAIASFGDPLYPANDVITVVPTCAEALQGFEIISEYQASSLSLVDACCLAQAVSKFEPKYILMTRMCYFASAAFFVSSWFFHPAGSRPTITRGPLHHMAGRAKFLGMLRLISENSSALLDISLLPKDKKEMVRRILKPTGTTISGEIDVSSQVVEDFSRDVEEFSREVDDCIAKHKSESSSREGSGGDERPEQLKLVYVVAVIVTYARRLSKEINASMENHANEWVKVSGKAGNCAE